MLIDEIFGYLRSKTLIDEWSSLDEVRKLIVKGRIDNKEVSRLTDFLNKYFFELDSASNLIKLNKWTTELMSGKPI